jgi:hypothetical protein
VGGSGIMEWKLKSFEGLQGCILQDGRKGDFPPQLEVPENFLSVT